VDGAISPVRLQNRNLSHNPETEKGPPHGTPEGQIRLKASGKVKVGDESLDKEQNPGERTLSKKREIHSLQS